LTPLKTELAELLEDAKTDNSGAYLV
jgi:hypothetical protein